MVQSQHNSFNISISQFSNTSTLGKIFADQAIGTFIGSTLPGSLWMSEIYLRAQFLTMVWCYANY